MFSPLPTDRKVKTGMWKMRNHPIIIHVQRSEISSAHLIEGGFYTYTYIQDIGNFSNAHRLLGVGIVKDNRPKLSVVK